MAAHRDWVERNPALAKRVSIAMLQAAQWANQNHTETSALLARYTKIEPAMIATFPRITYAESNDPAYVQPVIDLMARYGILPNAFAARELFAPQIA
jgi:ABC-type nitrate/sulfonate/bicarbonate transport system substrate-binding protein